LLDKLSFLPTWLKIFQDGDGDDHNPQIRLRLSVERQRTMCNFISKHKLPQKYSKKQFVCAINYTKEDDPRRFVYIRQI
jgi:hypothetical protein